MVPFVSGTNLRTKSHLSDNPRIDLTTVHQEAAAIARHSVQLAVDMLEESRSGSADVVLEPKLVVRGTTAAPRDRTTPC